MPVGTRIRTNNAFGTITNNPLTAGATSFNSVELAILAEVAGNHAVITFDPLRTNGEPEIVVVTAHGAGAQSATIQRGQYGTVARQHPAGTVWVHAPINEDVIVVTTSSARPSNPYEGQFIYETDTFNLIGRINGTWRGLIPPGAMTMFGGSSAPTGWLLCNGQAVSRTTFADLFAIIGVSFGPGDGSTTFNVPDFRDRFPLGPGAVFPGIGTTGGSADDVTNHQHGMAHTHSLSSHTHTTGTHDHGIFDPGHNHFGSTSVAGSHTHTVAGGNAGAVVGFRTDAAANGHVAGGLERETYTTIDAAGSHQHGVNAGFTGINSTGGSGNLVSGSPSNNNTGASTATVTTITGSLHGNMPPYLTANFIIKY